MPLEFHLLEPTSLLQADTDPQIQFESLWSRTVFPEDDSTLAWRAMWFLPEDDGLVLKAQRSPRRGGLLQRMDRSFRLVQETKGLLAFRRAGASVPDIMAWGVERRGLLPVRTLLLERRIPAAVDLQAFLEQESGAAARRRALRAVGDAVRHLHGVGMFHGDLAARNVLVRPESAGVGVWFIDCPQATTRAARWRHDYLARRDRILLAHHLTRAGAARDEVEFLLEACGEDRLGPATYYAENRERERSSPRSQLWLWSGR